MNCHKTPRKSMRGIDPIRTRKRNRQRLQRPFTHFRFLPIKKEKLTVNGPWGLFPDHGSTQPSAWIRKPSPRTPTDSFYFLEGEKSGSLILEERSDSLLYIRE